MEDKSKVAVIGSGTWATAIVKILLNNFSSVYWWVREPEIEEGIKAKGRNPLYLSSALLDKQKICISTDLKYIVSQADTVVLVVPSAYLFSTLSVLQAEDFRGKNVISAIKGLVPERMETISSYLVNVFNLTADRLGVISGPSHAEEIATERLTYLASASANGKLAEETAVYFRCNYVRVHVSNDMEGIEFSVVLKNIYALAAGIFRGIGYGDNLLALFNTNCLNEMTHFISSLFPNADRNVFTAPYLGDFLVTAYSQFSRNRSFGIMIGNGYSVRTAQLEMKMIAEGYYAARSIHEINLKHNVHIPIAETVYRILYENASPKIEILKLLEGMR
ncbi:MAG: NAD(P)-binding domain-containing protein [Lentimicrobiaceae bacterium]|nr:NAD(P)-binding domain-containing protein [Lentimicrobiaceae bacterium]